MSGVSEVTMKLCIKCRAPKPLSDYWRDPRSVGGHKHTCIACMAAGRAEARRLASEAAQRQQAASDRAERSVTRKHDRDPDVRTYRAEKRQRDRRTAQVLAEAKAAFDAMMAEARAQTKGGRKPTPRVGRLASSYDPANALVLALEAGR